MNEQNLGIILYQYTSRYTLKYREFLKTPITYLYDYSMKIDIHYYVFKDISVFMCFLIIN